MIIDEDDRKRHEHIGRKAHTKDIFGMEPATRSRGVMDTSGKWKTQETFKKSVQSLKDFKAGLFLLDFVDKIVCKESPADVHEGWDQCIVHFRNRTQEFYDIKTILTDEHKVKNIMSKEGAFKIEFSEPSQIELFTWKGSLIDLNPNEIKRVVTSKRISPIYRKKVAYRMRFTNKAMEKEIAEHL